MRMLPTCLFLFIVHTAITYGVGGASLLSQLKPEGSGNASVNHPLPAVQDIITPIPLWENVHGLKSREITDAHNNTHRLFIQNLHVGVAYLRHVATTGTDLRVMEKHTAPWDSKVRATGLVSFKYPKMTQLLATWRAHAHITVHPNFTRISGQPGACVHYHVGACPHLHVDLPGESVRIWRKEPDALTVSHPISQLPSVVRSKRSTDVLATSLKCPVLSSFEPINPYDLRCGKIEKQLSQITTTTVFMAKPTSVSTSGPVCQCMQYRIDKYCWTNFFGPKETWDEVKRVRVTDSSQCVAACEKMFSSGLTSYTIDTSPKRSCWWLKTEKVSGNYWVATTATAKVFGPQSYASNGPISSGALCKIDSRSPCPGTGDSVVLTKSSLQDYIQSCQETEIPNAELTLSPGNYSALRAPGIGSVYLLNNCHLTYYGKQYRVASDGTLWRLTRSFNELKEVECNYVPELGTTTTLSFDSLFATSAELRSELQNCMTRRQVVIHALAIGSVIGGNILEGLTLGDTANFALVSYQGRLLGARCSPVDYTQLLWASNDIWLAYMNGVIVGCMDARVPAIFSDCTVYNETSVWKIDNQWDVSRQGDKYEASYNPTNTARDIAIITSITSDMSAHLDALLNPPIYPPNVGVNGEYIPEDTPSETIKGPFEWFENLDLFGKIGSVIAIFVGVVLLIMVVYLIVKLCTSSSKRRSRTPEPVKV